jgi:hypothetical protein
MSAFLFIQQKRKILERIEFLSTMRQAMHGESRAIEKQMERWAREVEIRMTFED